MADDTENDSGPQDQQPADGGGRAQPDDGKGGKKPDDGKGGEKPDDGKGRKKDDDQPGRERGDQFTEATGDPLAGALGGTGGRAAEGQAYRTWVRTVRSSGAAAFVGGGNIGVLNVTTAATTRDRLGQAPGPVRREILDELIGRYAPVTGYEAFVERLMTGRLLVLRGAPGTGRATTGLRLLAAVADDVARFGSDTDLRSLTADDLKPGSGYLLELLPGAGPARPTAVHVDRLCDQLASSECHLVLITQHDIRYLDAFHGYVADCMLPDPRQVLDRAVEHETRLRPDLEAALRQAAADVQLDGPDGARTPSEVGWLVAHVVSRAAGKITPDELARLSRESLSRHVSGWFEPLASLPASAEGDEQVRLGAFRIALAVLNETPFDLVAEAAEGLTWQILMTRSPRRMPGRPVFAGHREDFVANSRAHLTRGMVKIIDASAPAILVTYDDDRLPIAVLRHVWAVHNVRGPLISWLQSLSSDLRPFVYTRAALAIGLLSSWDFSYTFHELIEPWARSPEKKAHRRWAAAIALDEASRNDEVLPVVREILETWCRKGTYAQRWTGATALGYDLGLRDPSKALRELRRLACWEDGDLAQVASWAAARIFALGGIEPVLKALHDWLRDDRLAVRGLGLLAVLRIADMKVSDLEDLDLTSQTAGGRWTQLAHRSRWPLPVALAHEDPGLLDPLADLVWRLTRTAPAQLPVLQVLTKWMRAGEKDRTCVGPVGRFLALLGDDASDRARLLHLVSALRRDRDEPLPAEIAARYVCAIEKNIHTGDEMG